MTQQTSYAIGQTVLHRGYKGVIQNVKPLRNNDMHYFVVFDDGTEGWYFEVELEVV